MRFYKCNHCGNIIEMVKDVCACVTCCGEKMSEIVPGTVEAAHEKHIPVVTINGNVVEVNVGEVNHPMIDAHYIEWVVLETNEGIYRKHLNPGAEPHVNFAIKDGENVVAAYAYCNLHGLWKK